MTPPEFRGNPAYTQRMRELLNDPVLDLAFEVLRDSNPPIDPPASADAIASVRILSQITGYRICLDTLRSLSMPIPIQTELEADYSPSNL